MKTVITHMAMGTTWRVSFVEELTNEMNDALTLEIKAMLDGFEGLYSRFRKDSLTVRMSHKKGVYEVPSDLVEMLKIYRTFYNVSGKKFTPCIGSLLEDAGYDAGYSFTQKEVLRTVPDFDKAVEIIDQTHIALHELVLLDFGAVGKGYCVDLVSSMLRRKGLDGFLVDGSGDVYFESKNSTITAGLEHPYDTTLVIGSVEMSTGAMCSSSTNRRRWGKYSHYIDPETGASPDEIVAVWVMTHRAAYADALSSLLFFTAPENAKHIFPFEYCCMNSSSAIKKSPGFLATFY